MFLKCLLLLFVLSFVEADYPQYYRGSTSSCVLPRLKNGRARPRQRGTFIKYSCFTRYTLVGDKYATCRFGQWDVPTPLCVRSGCQPLEEVKNSVNLTSHNAWVVFFCVPGHQLVGSPAIYCDGFHWNSTAPECVASTKQPATECDFEEPNICGWKPDEFHDFDWTRLNKKTPSSFLQTGPTYDHTYGKNKSGYYMYVESTGRITNETARLISPVYDADMAKNGCFVFWYHMFGRSMGGLVVYQKPVNLAIYQLQQLRSQSQAQNYTLFEQWGDQGNEWYSAVTKLFDVGENFQIVIEGIRGANFMSDLAIDDVSIQHGENCTKAMVEATTPPSVLQESCVGRCDLYAETTGYRGCSCSIVCVVTQNCCPDFLDVCDFDGRVTSDDDSTLNSSVAPPQTQKLIATTTETLPSKTTSTTMSTPMKTSTTTTTTRRPPLPTIRKTTSTPTTKRPTTKTTTIATTTTTTTTISPRPQVPKKITPRTTTTTLKPIFTRRSTTLTIRRTPFKFSSTILHTRTTKIDARIKTNAEKTTEKSIKAVKNELVVKTNAEKTTEKSIKALKNELVAKKTTGLSGATIAVTVLLVGVACVGVVWIASVMKRSARGVFTIARLRGRATSDPEVHYLTTDVEDE